MLCPLVISQKFTLENRQGFTVAAIGGSTHTQHSTEERGSEYRAGSRHT